MIDGKYLFHAMHPPVNVMFTYSIYEKNEKQCGIKQIQIKKRFLGKGKGTVKGIEKYEKFLYNSSHESEK